MPTIGSIKSVAAGAACVLALWSPGAVGAPLDVDGPITRVTVNEVRVDAVVTDSKGNPIPDVPADDFQVLQDGKRQAPIHVQYVAGRASPRPAGSHELTANDVKRTIVVLLDDQDMSFASFYRSRQAVQQYLDRAMQPGDLVSILPTTQTFSYLNPFTSDPAAVRLTIAQMHYHPPSETLNGAMFYPVFPLMRSVLSALNRMPGRKSLIVFSDHMSMPNSPMVPDAFRRLADSALRSAVRIYGIDSRGLFTQAPISPLTDGMRTSQALRMGDASVSRPADLRQGSVAFQSNPRSSCFGNALNEFATRPTIERTPCIGDLDGLHFLADETGGLMMENNNDLGRELRKALQDQSGYYLISWSPGEKAFELKKGTFADFHNITVTLTRAGLKVRTPRGFYGIDSSTQQASLTPRLAMQEALLSPFQAGEFNLQMNSAFDVEGGRDYIRSFVYIDGKDIKFALRPENGRNDCYSIGMEFLTLPQSIDSSADTFAESQITDLSLCGASYEAVKRNGLAVTMLHPVDKPGGYLMRLAVRNVVLGDATPSLPSASSRLVTREEGQQPVGSAHELVVVPDLKKSPSVFGLRVQSGGLPVSVTGPKSQGETAKSLTIAYRPALQGDPAIRTFRAGETLQFDAHVVNVTGSAAEIRILRADSDAGAAATEAATVRDGDVTGSYAIASSLAPGIYDLQLIVTGKDGKGQAYRGVQDIDFTVSR